MTPSDELFKLIHSLSPSEKRHFSLMASAYTKGKAGNFYLQLFDAINKQKKYDEVALKKKFSGQASGKIFSVLKVQLYQIILRNLSNYHTGNSTEMELNEGIKCVEILIDHGLYDQCFKLLNKLKALAFSEDRNLIQMQLVVWEKKLLQLSALHITNPAYLDALNAYGREAYRKVINTEEYVELSREYSRLDLGPGVISSDHQMSVVNNLLENPLLRLDEKALSISAKLGQLQLRSLLLEAKGDLKSSIESAQALLDVFGKKKTLINDEPHFYIFSLFRLFNLGLKVGDYAIARENLKQFDFIRKNINRQRLSNALKSTIFVYQMSARLRYTFITKDISILPDIDNSLELGLKEFKGMLGEYMVLDLQYRIARIYFISGNYKRAFKWLRPLLNTPLSQVKNDLSIIVGMARILQIAIHYEEGDLDLIKYLLRSSDRFFKGKGNFWRLQLEFLQGIRKVVHAKDFKARTVLFRSMYNTFQQLLQIESEKKALYFFEFDVWALEKAGIK